MPILIGKVRETHGWLGNMSPHSIEVGERLFLTSEALFQCLRFDDAEIIEEIAAQSSPMAAKMKAKKHKAEMIVEPMNDEDVDNMRLCLSLKLKQNPELLDELLATGDEPIIEDCTKRPNRSGLFWGMALKNGEWVGENTLGKLWMELRNKVRAETQLAA